MRKKSRRLFLVGVGLIAAFVLWTVLICTVDVRMIGPKESRVGFAALNGAVRNLTGVNMALYVITDLLGLVPIGVAIGFAVLGLVQWVERKSLLKVDRSLLALGVFYMIVIVAYAFFEIVNVNYRPVLIDGRLEASYPSSTTMLVMCVMPTAMIQLRSRIKHGLFGQCVMIAIIVFIAFMIIGRLISGVHWITDIIGGAWFSAGIVTIYASVCDMLSEEIR